MSVIEKKLLFEGSKGKAKYLTLFDSGSTYSCIQKELAEKIGNLDLFPEPRKFETAEKRRKIEAKYRISIDFYINSDRFSDEFMVLEELSDQAIIGAMTLQKWRMKLDFENDEILYDPRVLRLRIGKIKYIQRS